MALIGWFVAWRKNSLTEVESFKKDYQDPNISIDSMLSKYKVFGGDFEKIKYAARTFRIKSPRVNQYTSFNNSKEMESPNAQLEKELFEKGSVDLKVASEAHNLSKDDVRKRLQNIAERKGRILKQLSSDVVSLATEEEHMPENIYEKDVNIILVSGLFMGLNRQRLHFLEALKKQIIPKEKASFLVIAGNLAMGIPDKDETTFLSQFNYFMDTFNNGASEEPEKKNKKPPKISESDKLYHAQVEYITKYFPEFPGVKTYLIGGYRDLRFKNRNVAQAVCFKRKDLKYRGTRVGLFRLRGGGEMAVICPITKPWRVEQPAQPLHRESDDYLRSIQKEDYPLIIAVGGYGYWNGVGSEKPFLLQIPNLSKPAKGENVGVAVVKVVEGKVDRVKFIDLSDYLEPDVKIGSYGKLNIKQKKMFDLIQSKASAGEISRSLEISKKEVLTQVEEINKIHTNYISEKSKDKRTEDLIILPPSSNEFKININTAHNAYFDVNLYQDLKKHSGLFMCCTHLGGLGAQPDIIQNDIPEIAVKEKIDFIAHHGDIKNGTAHHNINERQENIIDDVLGQDEFAAEVIGAMFKKIFNSLKKLTFLFRLGNHDEWDEEHGIVPLKHFETVLRYKILGAELSQFVFKGTDHNVDGLKINMVHYHSAGSKIRSTAPKKAIDNIVSYILKGIAPDFHIHSGGNFHINWFGFYKGYVVVMVPCLQTQTKYEAGKTLYPEIGFPIVNTYLKNNKIAMVEIKYYDLTKKAVVVSSQDLLEWKSKMAKDVTSFKNPFTPSR